MATTASYSYDRAPNKRKAGDDDSGYITHGTTHDELGNTSLPAGLLRCNVKRSTRITNRKVAVCHRKPEPANRKNSNPALTKIRASQQRGSVFVFGRSNVCVCSVCLGHFHAYIGLPLSGKEIGISTELLHPLMPGGPKSYLPISCTGRRHCRDLGCRGWYLTQFSAGIDCCDDYLDSALTCATA